LLAISQAVLRRPTLWILVHLFLGILVGLGLPRLEVRTDGASIHPRGHPTVELSKADRQDFSETEQVIVLLSSREDGPDVASPEGFAVLERLHRDLETFPWEPSGEMTAQRGGVRSLVNLLAPPSRRRFVLTRAYLETDPATAEEFDGLLARIRAHPLADGLFLSPNGRAAALYVAIGGRPEHRGARQHSVGLLGSWLADFADEAAGWEVRLTGPVTAEVLLGESVLQDLLWLAPLMVVVIAVLLFAALRTVAGVLIPLLEVLLVLIWTFGAMAWAGVPVTLVTSILPVVLMSIAVLDEIHLLERLESRLADSEGGARTAGGDRERLRGAVLAALADVGRPIVLTSLTTAAAFLSFLTAAMTPVRHLGLFTAFGIVVAMLLTFTLIPALVMCLPISWLRPVPWRRVRSPGGLRPWERLAGRHGPKVAIVCLVIAAPGLFRLSVQDSWIDNFDPGSQLVTAEGEFNQRFWGAWRLDVVCRGEDPRRAFFLQPEGAALMEEVRRLARDGPHVGGVVTHLLPFELVARAQGHRGALSELTALKLKWIERRLALVRERIDLGNFLSADFRSARARILVRSPDYRRGRALEDHLKEGLQPLLRGRAAHCHLSGDLPVALAVVHSIVGNQLLSIASTLAALAVLLVLATGSVKRTFSLLLPVVASVWLVFAVMGYLALPLGIATSMFAALSIGVGVDFALHLAHAYDRHRKSGVKHGEALAGAFATAGRALRWNVLVLASGFLVLTASALRPNHSLGMLLAVAVLSGYLMTLLILPRLLEKEYGG